MRLKGLTASRRDSVSWSAPAPGLRAAAPQEAAGAGSASRASHDEAKAENLHVIESPIVGTFYGSPCPDAPPFVRAGDHVTPGRFSASSKR